MANTIINEVNETGGARIGIADATWPFAKLIVNRNQLTLNASLIGNLVFKPADVVSIIPYTVIPFLGQGIQIIHNVEGYNPKVIFWTMGSPTALIARLAATGFLDNTQTIAPDIDMEITSKQSSGGFPLKIPAAIAIVVIWNAILLPAIIDSGPTPGAHFVINARIDLAFVFLTSLLTLISEHFRILILKPGRTLGDIKGFLFFLMFLTGAMFIGFSLVRNISKLFF